MRRLPLILVCLGGVAAAQPAPDAPAGAPAEPPAPPPVPAPAPTPPSPPPATASMTAPPAVAPTPPPSAPPPSAPAPSEQSQEALASYEPSSVSIGGYLQPQFRLRQNSPAQFDQDGFKFARARVLLSGQTRAGNLQLSATVEAEMQPTFAMQDAYGTVARTFPASGGGKALPGRLSIDGGQMRVPISRQNLLSDSRLSFVDKAQLATIAPDRDLGARLTAAPPRLPIKMILGAFDGEGKNQVENINESYLYAGRLEISPFGRDLPIAESAFAGKLLTLGLSYGHNKLTSQGNGHELVSYYGADLAGAWKGLSGAFEYLMVKHAYEAPGDPSMLPPAYKANGWAAQLAYLLPIKLPPLRQARLRARGARRGDRSQRHDPDRAARRSESVRA